MENTCDLFKKERKPTMMDRTHAAQGFAHHTEIKQLQGEDANLI